MYDQARTALSVAQGNLKSIAAQQAVVQEQEIQGKVLAPTAGRVITVPVTTGTVVMGGDVVATVAEHDFVLRLQIPERHARYLKVGAPVRLDGDELGLANTQSGVIRLIYPQVDNGHVVADATVVGLEDYFVGQRIRVWISAGQRSAILVPLRLIVTRFGLDYVRLWTSQGAVDVPVQRGVAHGDRIEILSGLKAGDRLLRP
jgi:multidrug resistance efflux pump